MFHSLFQQPHKQGTKYSNTGAYDTHSHHHNMKSKKCEDGVTDAGLQQQVSGSTPHK